MTHKKRPYTTHHTHKQPLSVSSESTWQTHFQDQELQEVIERDVLRTLPTLHFFSTPERVCSEHGAALIRVLFVYAKTNSPIRYVQGMNEVLAPLYYVFATTGAEAERAHAEADAFACFARLMGETNDIFNKARDKDMLNPDSTVGRYQALLARLDPALYRDLAAKGIDPRFYALRWLSLLFSQELPLADVERLWDSLFADEDRFTFLLFFACTIVIERRPQILASDFSRTLYLLQNLRVDAIQDTITYADRLMKFTNPDHLNPHVMADYMRELSRQDAPSGADLLERDSKALQSEIVCCFPLSCSSCSFFTFFVVPSAQQKHQRERTPSASSPTPHESTDTPHRGALPGSLPDEFCTLAWHDSHDSS